VQRSYSITRQTEFYYEILTSVHIQCGFFQRSYRNLFYLLLACLIWSLQFLLPHQVDTFCAQLKHFGISKWASCIVNHPSKITKSTFHQSLIALFVSRFSCSAPYFDSSRTAPEVALQHFSAPSGTTALPRTFASPETRPPLRVWPPRLLRLPSGVVSERSSRLTQFHPLSHTVCSSPTRRSLPEVPQLLEEQESCVYAVLHCVLLLLKNFWLLSPHKLSSTSRPGIISRLLSSRSPQKLSDLNPNSWPYSTTYRVIT
jgi:hypothetical protein